MNKRKTSIKALARRLPAIAALGVIALFSLLPSAVRGDTVEWAGITVTYSGAAVSYSGSDPASSDLILTYTDTSTVGTLSLPEAWAARYLVVGGGGAGGTVRQGDYGARGQGGGGGAGGFLTGDTTLAAQPYSIYVGAGGTPAANQDAAVSGGDGHGSAITNDTTSAAVAYALGGGGGGARAVGRNGASGGGGSADSNNASTGKRAGGSGVSGQGSNGGAGNNIKYAGGGGGAGASGGDTGKSTSGAGGDGLPSDITGETKYYAGGGGGGRSTGTPAMSGGAGGGGEGGLGTEGTTASPGEEATGGGGGGGGRYSTGGAGGSGIVVIRLLMPAIAPTAKADQYFTGAELNGVDDPGSNWVLDHGDMVATNADTYTFWVKPAGTLKWKDSSGTELRELTWKILPSTVPEDQEPQATNLVYNGEEQCGVTPSSSSFYTLIDARQTAAGNYTATARLNNPSGYSNCTWHDGTTGDRTINFTIDQLTVKRPTAKSGLAYTGNPQNGINDSEHAKFYVLGGVTNAVNTGSYVATAAIGDAHQGSCVWETKPGDTTPVNDTIEIPWSIGGYVVAKPTAVSGLVYDGANKVGITPTVDASLYTIVGNTATNAGSYTAYATLTNSANYQWAGEDLGVATIGISWSIARQPVPQISIPDDSFVYDTGSHFVDVGPAGWTNYSHITEGVTNAVNVGEYPFTVALNDSNHCWDTSPASWAPTTIVWTITKAPVRPPTVVSNLVYNANIQYGVVDSEDASLYQLNGGFKGRVNAGSYFAEFRLLDSANYAWVGGSSANLSLDWSIAQAPNAITVLKLPSWKSEEVPVEHRVTVDADWKGDGEPKIDYSTAETGPWTENQPTNVGVYFVRATVAETANWAAAERTAKFSIWSDPDRIFRDYVDLRVQGYRGSEPLTNFPLLVRISESRLRGFYYSRAGRTGEDMVFMDTAADAQLPYEVDTWNVTGESLVWVRVSVLTNGAPIRMYWTLREGADAPGYSPEEVWSDYVGVWHFADQGVEPSSDATGNGNLGYPDSSNPTESISVMTHTAANIGQGRIIGLNGGGLGGCRLVVSNTPSFHFDGKLTISGWLKMTLAPSGGATATAGRVWPFSRRNVESAADTDFGAYFVRSQSADYNLRGMKLFGSGTSSANADKIWPATILNTWSYFGAAYNGGAARVCGAQMGSANFVERGSLVVMPPVDSGENLAFGNIPGTNNTYYSFAGVVDEYRLTKEVRTPGWMQAEFDTVNDKAFCTNSLVVKDGLKVNYWLDYPAFAPLAMEAGEYPTVCYNGRLAEGWASTNYVNVYDSSTNSVYPTAGGSYRVVFALDESYTGYELLEAEKGLFNLTLNGKSPYTDIAGNLGDTGRILLMNRQREGTKNIVRYQGYTYNTKDRSAYVDNQFFWDIIEYSPANNDACPNLKGATESIFWTQQHGARLWHLLNCRHGNTMGSALRNTQNYFSFSPSSYSIDDREAQPATAATAGQIVMRNIGAENSEDSATVYSSCFTNGIGTIYFDAVNGWNNNIGNNYGLCVEICTNVLGDATALIPPTDENILGVTIETNDVGGVEVVTTNYSYYANAVWRRVPFVAYKRDNTPDFVREEVPSNGINLSVVNGGTTTNFYRMAVPLDIRIPVRFRIRRTSSVPIATTPLDGNALILLDNVLVSYPAMSADLKPLGFYDTDRRGKQVLGQEIAFETPFPAQTDTGVFARAEPYYYINPGVSGADTNRFVVAANLHYRWRYLRQRAEPVAQIAQLDPSYVNYYNDSLWRTVPLNPRGGYRSIDPLVLPAAAGDVEFWYDLTMDTPYYEYVDYSGLDYGVPYDERHTAVTNHMTAAEMEGGDELLPTTGLDWFVRLREGKSDFEGMRVVVEGELGGEYEMDPIEDNMWRALVKIPPDKVPSGTTVPVSFYFVGVNRQVRGATEFVENTVYFGPNSAETVVMPANGKLESYDSPSDVKKVSADVDSSTGYLELKISDRYLTWAASRAEYQNFNNWSDAHRLDKKFCVASGTNGVDDVKMKTYNLDMGEWDQFDPGSTNWNETFWLANYNDTGFPKEKFFQDHITPNDWNGHNLTFVSRDLNKYIAPTAGDTVSHMGAKLQGQGEGFLEFSLTDRPKGLGSVKVSSRIGQSISFDNMCYNTVSLYDIRFNGLSGIEYFYRTNYVFFAPVLMSSLVRGNAYTGYGENYNGVEGIMAVGASVSVVAYYWPGIGCYEFRLSRQSNNANNNGPRYVLELFRWSNENGKIAPTRLCTQQFDSRIWYWETGTSTSPTSNSQYNPYFWGMFISVENTPSGTLVIGGISQDATLPISNAAAGIKPDWNAAVNRASGGGGLQNGFRGIAYRDNSASRLTYGGYGVNAKDCPVRFVGMHHYDSPVPQSNIRYTDNYTPPSANASKYFNSGTSGTQNPWLRFSESSPVPETDALEDGRWASQSRLETFTFETSTAVKLTSATEGFKHAYCGVRMPGADSLRQEVVLMLQPAGGGEWQKYASATNSGYGFKTSEFLIHTTGSWNSRITTGSDNVELVVSSVEQTCWEAPDHEDLLYGDDEFVYTQGIVSTNETAHQQELLLQPSRGEPKKAMSMRAPLLHGLGKVSFSYTGVDANAEIWVQMATNDVESNIIELNTTVKEGPEYWITIGKYAATYKPGVDGLLVTGSGKTGSITHYLGLHDRTDRPLRGLFRILVPTNVVVAAREAAYLSDNVNYGNITIRSMTVTDEPALSERCWRGWNLRTVGDSTDSESRMYLSDTTIPNETGSGLVGALNNTVAADTIDDDPERAMADYPTVYSPTFQVPKGRKSGIGSVDFRARLYSTSSATLPKGGKIWLYGSTSSVDGPWTLLGEYVVDSPVMKTFTWSTGKENYLAAKFAISDPSAKTVTPAYERIILDEITIREKVQPSVGFLYARPFRNYLFDPVEVADILSPSEQPLVGESWGVQTKVVLRQLADEIDLSKGFRVSLSYYNGDKWGYPQWRGEPDAVTGVDLVPVGDPTNLVFRSVGTSERTLVPPAEHGGVVQYQLAVRYYDRGGIPYDQILETYSDWTQPSWYYPVDKNVDAGGDSNPEFFSPYTILDAVSPGRAWINEINFNDGEPDPDINGGVRPEDNQFIELCIPSGIDMSGWKLRLTDMNPGSEPWVMAKLGDNGLPASKISHYATNSFEFYVLESPRTELAGGINRRDPALPEADGTWNRDGPRGTAQGGTLVNSFPYQLELVRPNGIVEHQIVFEGTNTVADRVYGYAYTATNLASVLSENEKPPSTKRMVICREVERAVADPDAFGSSGVVRGDVSGNPAPGDKETWDPGLRFTPGWLNEGQIIPAGWFLAPNGTNCWVYFVNSGSHIVQSVGTNTAPYMVVVVPKDTTTNVVYTIAKWYAMNLEENGVPVAEGLRGTITHPVTPTSTTYRVVATETRNPLLDPLLADGFGQEGNPYADSIVNWLTKYWPGSDAEDFRAARFQGLNNTSTNLPLSLTEMYWLDIPPVPESPLERESPDHGSNWWLRAGITKSPTMHMIYRTRGGREVCFTNHVVDMQMYITNTVTGIVHAPQRLRGLDDAQSDNWSGAWTSETFKVRSKLDLTWLKEDDDFHPFRFFIFDAGSFTGPDGGESENVPAMGPIGPYSARIEVLDPHSTESIGANYGWQNYPNTKGFYLWSVDTDANLIGVETLKFDDTLPERLTTP